MGILPAVGWQDNYKVFEDGVIAYLNAALHWPFSQEREKEMGKEEEEEEEEEEEKEENQKKKKKKKRRRRSDKVGVSMEEECETDAHNSQGPISAEHRELVKYVRENLKEMKTKFTDEEVYEMLKLCNMDPELAIQRLKSLEGFEEVKSKWTKKKERIAAQWSKSQHEVGSSSGQNQGESVNDNDAGRTDTTSDSTVQGLQEADSSARSQLDNVSSPPAAAVSSVASQLHGPNIGNRKGKEVVRSVDDNTAVISRSHDPPLHAVDPPKLHAPGAGSAPRASKNNVASSSRNDLGKLPTALGSLSTMRNGEFSGERSIRGPQTDGTEVMPSESKELLIPRTHASEAGADASNPNSGSSGTSESELLPTSSEPTIHAEESKTQHEVSSGSIVKQGGNCDDDDAGRTDKTHDDTVQGLQEADSEEIPQLDNVSSPPAAAVSSVASQLHGPNIGSRKGKEVVRSVDDNTAVISRSHDPPLHAVDPPKLHAPGAGSESRASKNNVASSSRNDLGKLPTASGSLSTLHNGEFSGERSIRGPQTDGTDVMPSESKELLIPRTHASEAGADASNPISGSSRTSESELLPTSSEPTIHAEESKTQHEVSSGSIVKQRGNCDDDDAARTDKTQDDTVQGLQEADSKGISESDDVSSPPAAAVSSVASQLHGPNMGNRKGKEVVRSVDDNNAVISRSHDPPLHAVDPLRLRASSAGSDLSQLDDVSSPPAAAVSSVASQLHGPNMGNRKGKEVVRSVDDNNAVISRSHDPPLHAVDPLRLRASSAGSHPWASRNNAATVFAHQASAGSSSTHNWNGNESSGEKSIWGEWKVFLTPDREKLDIPQAVYDAFNNPNPGSSGTWERKLSPTSSEPHDNVPSTQQDEYHGGSSSRAKGNASGRGSFQGAGRTCYQSPPIPPYSPAPSNIPRTRSGSALHAQHLYRNDNRPLTIPGPTATPDGIFPTQALRPANANNRSNGKGSFPQYDNRGARSQQHPRMGVRPNQYGPFNIPRTSSGFTLHAWYRCRNDSRPLTIPGQAANSHGSFTRRPLLLANANNRRSGEGTSPQYDNQGGQSWQRPGSRVRPNHQQQSSYNRTTGNLQDPSSMQPPRDSGP